MKYGIIDFNLTVNSYWNNTWNKKALLNIGDAAEYLVIEQILRNIGIKDEEFYRLSIRELISYRGEYLIVPLNIAFDSYIGYNKIFENLSPDIIPVFLGISLTNTNLNETQLACLKKYEPIGCRDERTFLYLQSKNILAYLNGCIASILDINYIETNLNTKNKILFIDVPRNVMKFVPNEIKKDIVFINQEIYCRKNEFPENLTLNSWCEKIFSCYKNPQLIVTSRFHGAVLALANNIPCILTLEKYTFRFSWLTNYCDIYTEQNYKSINWKSEIKNKVNLKLAKQLMNIIAKNRINETIEKYKNLLMISELQKSTYKEERNSSNQVLYYKDCIKEIDEKWRKIKSDEKIEFGFWGINDNANKILEFIKQNYPNAKLIEVYDMFKEIDYRGIKSIKPELLSNRKNQKNYYVIVTAYLASRVAPDIFEKIGFSMEKAFLCKREFITNEILKNMR